jgi:hypothetical protein
VTPDQDRVRSNGGRDPWANAPTSELGDQVLPRWFVLTAMVAVVTAVGVMVAAFVLPRPAAVPVEARRPPSSAGYTTAVGQVQVGGSAAATYDAACAELTGVRVAGAPGDRAQLRRGLAALCNTSLPDAVRSDLRAFAAAGGTVRFATFEATGVDSTATTAPDDPVILINTRFRNTDASWIAPLVVHDATLQRRDPTTAEAALAARRAEAVTCDRLLGGSDSRACADAAAITALDDPLAALRAAGFR